jgi:hypothetical protein
MARGLWQAWRAGSGQGVSRVVTGIAWERAVFNNDLPSLRENTQRIFADTHDQRMFSRVARP